jgi:choline-sulfatase
MAWKDLPAKPNLLVVITDQQRYPQHWPAGWGKKHLPATERLLEHGMSFDNAFTAACECSPSRAVFVTSTFDNTNLIFTTPPDPNDLPTSLPNLATILASAGYEVAWKGKWHLFAGSGQTSLASYGFGGWDPPDAGITLDTTLLGGGTPGTPNSNGNDPRFVSGPNGAVEFLQGRTAASPPFCLVVSLVNPHDVHVYTQDWASVGFPATIPDMGVGLPGNSTDPLTDKPTAQLLFRQSFDASSLFRFNPPTVTPAGYVNFYAYLETLVDQQIAALLAALDATHLTEKTIVVRMGDHGEMGMSHGLREKMYVAYDEVIHVPFIVSNPVAFPGPEKTDAFASLLDLVPTLAAVAGATPPAGLKGKDLTPILKGTKSSVQDAVLFCYDDEFTVSDTRAPTHIRAVRTAGWLYAVYFSESATLPFEFELYDLANDPGELTNRLSQAHYEPGLLDRWKKLNDRLLALVTENGAQPKAVTLPPTSELGPRLLGPPAHPADLAGATIPPYVEGK